MRFLGNIEAKIDAKGRAFLPAAFRKVLQLEQEENLVLRKDVFQDCLVLFPESVWNQQMDEMRRKLSRWNREQQLVFRQYVSDVELVALDGSGRLLIPRRLQQLAGIEQELKFIGMGDTIEIWAKPKATEPFIDAATFEQTLEALMSDDTLAF